MHRAAAPKPKSELWICGQFADGEPGCAVEHLLLGSQIETMSETELAAAADATSVFARLAPAHKERIIRALQIKGHVLGFLGDGINDAPALIPADQVDAEWLSTPRQWEIDKILRFIFMCSLWLEGEQESGVRQYINIV